jgi:Phosphatidylinositolglycan class N (PIG-N)
VEKAPPLYYAYHWLPLLLWWYVFRQSAILRRIKFKKRFFVWVALLVMGVELLVAAFFHRWFLSIGLCFMSTWPYWNRPANRRQHENFAIIWSINCIILALFPIFPPVGKHSLPILV